MLFNLISDPVWDCPPFTLTTWDAAFDMLKVEVVNDEKKQLIGQFEVPLLAVLMLKGADGGATGGADGGADGGATEGDTDTTTNTTTNTTTDTTPDTTSDSPTLVPEGWYPLFRRNSSSSTPMVNKRGELRMEMRFDRTNLVTNQR